MANNSAYLYLQYECFADTIVRNILQKELWDNDERLLVLSIFSSCFLCNAIVGHSNYSLASHMDDSR